jgi:hypothetical protein
MPKIQIGTDIINFPNNGSDALWSPAVIQFAEAVADTLAGIVSPYDVTPKVQTLNTDTNTNLDLVGATFDGGLVRKFSLSYAIYRTRTDSSLSISEAGTLTGTFNTDTVSWEIQDEYIGDRQANGEPYHKFNIGSEQVTLDTVGIGSPYDNINSKISFSAKTELVSAS